MYNKVKNNRFSFFLAIITLITMSFQFLLLSIESNQLAVKIIGNNPYLQIIGTTNNMLMFVYPICIAIFLLITIKLMLDIFDITSIKTTEIFTIIGLSCIVPTMGMFFYTMSFIFFLNDQQISADTINQIQFKTGLSIKDYQTINNLCWLIMFYLMTMLFYIKFKVSIVKSVCTCVLPTGLFLAFGYLIKTLI